MSHSQLIVGLLLFLFASTRCFMPKSLPAFVSPTIRRSCPPKSIKTDVNSVSDPRNTRFDNVPSHVAYIVDGNGRWAERQGLPRYKGHNAGANVTVEIVKTTFDAGANYITLFVFSTENWTRDPKEVHNIMHLLDNYLQEFSSYLVEHKIALRVIGEKYRLPLTTQKLIKNAGYQVPCTTQSYSNNNSSTLINNGDGEKALLANQGDVKTLCLAISYGGRQDILQSCQSLAQQVVDQQITIDEIDESMFAAETYSGQLRIPDPDLIVRTSGEFRLSNFLLWQAAYAELASVECLWPDFTPDMARATIVEYGRRHRRFGQAASSQQTSSFFPSAPSASSTSS